MARKRKERKKERKKEEEAESRRGRGWKGKHHRIFFERT